MLAEDHEPTRIVLEAVLRQGGYDVFSFPDGASCLAAVPEVEPAAVVTDLSMPRLDGLELARILADQDEDHRIPTILVTAHGKDAIGPSDEVRSLFEAVLTKPVDPAALLDSVARAVARA
jgi:CheY-like chemotaxis protein